MSPEHKYPPEYHKNSLEVLETALGKLGAYRPWRAFDPGPSQDVDKRYAALPALTKRDIREHFPRGFVPPGRDFDNGVKNGEIQVVSTSGSSDAIRVNNIWNQSWWDASEIASWKLNSHTARLATGAHPEAILVNARNVGIISDEVDLPFEKRRLARFLYLNEKTDPAAWSAPHMDRMINELNIFKPVILEANPSLLAKLCRYATATHKKIFQPGLIVFTYEFPSILHYRQIRRVFMTPTASSYGTTETGYVFMQCEAGKFHQNSDSCRVDFQPFRAAQGGPFIGRILVTTFQNPWYYMLRFDVGDIIRLDPEQKCRCGRDSGLIASSIEGRFTNATLACDGALVTLRHLDEKISALQGIDEYRLEQTGRGAYVLYLATPRRDYARLDNEAKNILLKLYGRDADISIIHEDFLKPDDSGKFNLAKTLFPLDIKDYLDTPRPAV
jgi:phenylacetate-coenzyme A ligase PaaK-like adenylate-forming protein